MSNIKKIFFAVLILSFHSAHSAGLKSNKVKIKTPKEISFNFDKFPMADFSNQDLATLEKFYKKEDSKRNPSGYSEIALETILNKDKDFTQFRDEYLALDLDNNPLLIETFVAKYQNLLDERKINSVNVEFAVNRLSLLLPYRSIYYKLAPLFDKNEANAINSLFITLAQQAVLTQINFNKQTQANALTRYLTEPFTAEDVKSQIHTATEFQQFLFDKIYPSLRKSNADLMDIVAKIANTENESSTFLISDNKLVFSKAAFQDGVQRYKFIGRSEIFAVMAAQESSLSQISFSLAYNFDGIETVLQKMGEVFGYDGTGFSAITGSTAKKRREVLDQTIEQYPNFLSRKTEFKSALARSFAHLDRVTRLAKPGWLNLKTRSSGYTNTILIPDIFRAYGVETQADSSLNKWTDMISSKSPVTITSALNNDSTRIYIRAFFEDKTSLKNLYDLLPREFDNSPRHLSKIIDISGEKKTIGYRNLKHGSPTAWNVSVYKMYFPDIQKDEDVPKAISILATSWGGGPFFAPLSMMIQ